ncbi:VOC family protein [Pricia sp.]|uniref:VOC family protein n=1 Tax=Pricia sp. TaxID=2268138 RepID=UPI0035934F97
MATINPYVTFSGNCEEAFNFYRTVFGGEFAFLGRFDQMPEDVNHARSEDDNKNIMHISLPISKETVLMGSDTGGEWASKNIVGTNVSISIGATSKEEADRLFKGLSEGGKITMTLENTFWGDYFGMCTDKFDINWMVNFNPNTQ